MQYFSDVHHLEGAGLSRCKVIPVRALEQTDNHRCRASTGFCWPRVKVCLPIRTAFPPCCPLIGLQVTLGLGVGIIGWDEGKVHVRKSVSKDI